MECRRRRDAGLGKFVDHGRKFRLHETAPVGRARVFKSSEYRPALTLSAKEMEANVGACRKISQRNAVRDKVKAYPHIYDKASVLARRFCGDSSCKECLA